MISVARGSDIANVKQRFLTTMVVLLYMRSLAGPNARGQSDGALAGTRAHGMIGSSCCDDPPSPGT
jgi:hypothetical protein